MNKQQQPGFDLQRGQDLVAKYPELEQMVGADTQATPENSHTDISGTVGAILFPSAEKSDISEFDRAYVGIRAMDWVRSGDYDSFTACQPAAAKLSHERFDWLHDHTLEVLPEQSDVDAMETFIAINDLGKIGSFVQEVAQLPGAPDSVDHDVIMHYGLQHKPALSPSYSRLGSKYQADILDGMATKFNLGQLMQAEGVAASLDGLQGLSKEARDFYLLHTAYDLAGAAGQFVQNGSVTMTEATVTNFNAALEAIEGIDTGNDSKQVYKQYLTTKAEQFGTDAGSPDGVAVTRLATMLRMSSREEAQKVQAVYDDLPAATRTILEKELGKAGTDDGIASLLYYSPALLANLQKQAGDDPQAWVDNMSNGFTTLARLYQEGRSRPVIKTATGNGIQTVLINELAKAAATDPHSLETAAINLSGDGFDTVATLTPMARIDQTAFPQLDDLAQLAGDRIGIVGMGGGSDGIQAAILSKLLMDAGKHCPAVVSIRTAKPQSQASDGTLAVSREVTGHGGMLGKGVYRMTPDTRGSGRFLEHLPAGELPMYLVTDDEVNPVTGQLQTVFDAVGGVDTVIGLDTGGDVLYPDTGHNAAVATPDQDIRSLSAIKSLGNNVTKYCVVVAPGIDSPDTAADILRDNHAVYFEPDIDQTAKILDTYRQWHMDGQDERYFGKTPLAWQAVLQAEQADGVITLPLPTKALISDSNPWNPYVIAQPAMRGAFIMELDNE